MNNHTPAIANFNDADFSLFARYSILSFLLLLFGIQLSLVSSHWRWLMFSIVFALLAFPVLSAQKNRKSALGIYLGISTVLFITFNIAAWLNPGESGLVLNYLVSLATVHLAIQDLKLRRLNYVIIGLSFLFYILTESVWDHSRTDQPSALILLSSLLALIFVGVLHYVQILKSNAKLNQVELELKAARKFTEFVNESALPLFRVNENGDALLMNESARYLFTSGEENRLNYPPGCSDAIFQAFAANTKQILPTYINGRHLRLNITPNIDSNFVDIYGEDFTEVEEANKQVQDLTNAIDFSADGVAVISSDWKFNYFNQSFAFILGCKKKEELIDQTLQAFLAPENQEILTEIEQDIRQAKVWRGEVQCRRIDGTLQETYLTLTRIPGGSMMAYLKDNTHIKNYQNQLILAKEAAEATTKAKSDFLATMSHEIRTPMNGVLGMSTLLSYTELSVETIQHSGQNLLTIINEILDFSKIEAGKMGLETAEFDLNKMVKNIVNLSSHRASTKSNILSYTCTKDMPSVVFGDENRITQILNNLIGNALKFTKNGTVVVNVDSSEGSMPGNSKLHFSVMDSGIGIAPEKIESLFEPFTQADSSTTRKYGGTGLGLAICKRLVELMGGKFHVESTQNKGSTFGFTIELKSKGSYQEEETIIHNDQPIGVLSCEFPMKIMVAEDNFINQKLAVYVFEHLGYDVHLVQNGMEAIDACKIEHFDLIFMDIHMPELDGITATKRILSEIKNPPVIVALTANVVGESQKECLEAGMLDFVHKPFKICDLERVIRAVRA
jgi:PAS domain S-box-containing protein